MKDTLVKILVGTVTVIAVVSGMLLCVVGGIIEGWWGAFFILLAIFIYTVLLYLYNKNYK